MSEKFLTKPTLAKVLSPMINDDCINKDSIMNLILTTIPSWSVEMLADLYFSNEVYKPVNINDYFSTPMNNYQKNKKYDVVILTDLGLCGANDTLYGKIIGDDSFGSSFNPFYGRYKTVLFLHGPDNKMIEYPETLSWNEITVISKMDIPYFNLPF